MQLHMPSGFITTVALIMVGLGAIAYLMVLKDR